MLDYVKQWKEHVIMYGPKEICKALNDNVL